MASTETSIEIVRTINAAAEELFAAWTDPQLLVRWLAVGNGDVRRAETDPREGGLYRVEVTGPDRQTRSIAGEYREFDPPRRLVMTWVEEDFPAEIKHSDETIVAVSFREVGPAVTELTIKHTLVTRAELGQSYGEAWAICLNKLAVLGERNLAGALAFAAW